MPRNYLALKAGDLDVMQAFEPFLSMAERDGAGDILYVASTRGPTAYTAFIATREACAEYRDEFAAMTRATAKMLAWLYANPAEELAKARHAFFPDVPESSLRARSAATGRRPVVARDPDDPARLRAPRRKACIRAASSGECRAMMNAWNRASMGSRVKRP